MNVKVYIMGRGDGVKTKKGILIIVLLLNLFVFLTSCLQVKWGNGLYGAVVLTERPNITAAGIMSGEFQQQLGEYFSENISLRELLVRGYNELLYQMKVTNNSVIVGKEDYLFSEDYVEGYYKYVQLDGVETTYPEYAEKVKVIQERLEEQEKIFIYLISPSKVEIYPEYVPEKYKYLEVKNRITNHVREVREFELKNVNYYDAQKDMLQIKEEIPAFYRQGIHWSYASCAYCMKGVFDRYINDSFMNVVLKKAELPSGADRDLYNLMNILSKPYEDEYYDVSIKYNVSRKPKIFILGTSFSDQIVQVLGNSFTEEACYEELVHYSYLNAGYRINEKGIENIELSLKLDETSILKDIEKSDIIIIENNATYIPDSYFITIDYLYENLK